MKAHGSFALAGIFLIFNGAVGRAIPDFYTDEDLNAWHKFGLRSFYGPWSVIARKPNGDFVSYADYGSRVPSDFRPISSSTIDDDLSLEILPQPFSAKYGSGISDSASGPEGQTDLSANILNLIPNNLLDEKNFETTTDFSDSDEKFTAASGEANDPDKKRDTLELIGIVGVISEDDDSTEMDGSTITNTDEVSDLTDENDRSTTTDQTLETPRF